jgi:probable phosphoglycerate mutase
MDRDDTTVIFVRHCETAWNCELRFQGQCDSPLTELGVRQARALGERLAGLNNRALYSSDLGRARQTAETIALATGHAIVFDERLRERGFGVFEGLTVAEIEERHPDVCARWRSRDPDYVIPGGESTSGAHARIIACFEELAGRHGAETIAVVSHGLVLDALYRHAAGIPLHAPRTLKLLNGSLNIFYCAGGSWRTGLLGDVAHLDAVAQVTV